MRHRTIKNCRRGKTSFLNPLCPRCVLWQRSFQPLCVCTVLPTTYSLWQIRGACALKGVVLAIQLHPCNGSETKCSRNTASAHASIAHAQRTQTTSGGYYLFTEERQREGDKESLWEKQLQFRLVAKQRKFLTLLSGSHPRELASNTLSTFVAYVFPSLPSLCLCLCKSEER